MTIHLKLLEKTIASFCDNLPTDSNLVHVNLTESGKTVNLMELMFRHEIITNRKNYLP